MDAVTRAGLPEEARPIVERTARVLGLSECEVVDVFLAIGEHEEAIGAPLPDLDEADLWRSAAESLDRSDDEGFADRMAAVFVVGLLGGAEDDEPDEPRLEFGRRAALDAEALCGAYLLALDR